MTDPQIRSEVVDLLMDQLDYGVTHTAEQQAPLSTSPPRTPTTPAL